MGKPLPLTAQTVVAISDARRVIYEVFARDGVLDAFESEALLLIDTAAYTGSRADVARRKSDLVRDTGDVTPWIERIEHEVERDFAHIKQAA